MSNFENREPKKPFIKNELIEFGGYGSIISKEEFKELVDGLSTAQQKSIKNILLKMNTSERKSFIDKVKKIKEESKKLKYQNDKKMHKLFESFKGNLNKTEKEELSNQKELFDIIKDEKLKEKIKSYINFLRNQNKSYFEINKNNEVDFIKDKEKFIKENLKDESSEIKTKFENLVASIINKKYVASYLEESGTYDKDIDKSKEKDLQEKYEKFMKLENKTYNDLLALPRKVRLKLCTQKKVNIDEIRTGEVNKLTFDFKFGKTEINRDIYLNTTAGQLLPAEVKQIVKNGQVYTRSGELGEFFSKSNRRLTIHQGTNITISKRKSILETLANRNIIKKELNIEDEKNMSLEDSIKLEAKLRGIDPKFALIAFKETLEKTPKEKQKYILENMLTEFDRIRGVNYYNKKDTELLLIILNKYNGEKFPEKAKEFGIKDEEIKKFNNRLKNFNKYHSNINTSIDFNEYNGAAAKIMGFALQAYKNKDILGAEHCTDWVDKVFKQTTGKSVYSSHTLFNGIKKISSGTGLGVKEYASPDQISQIRGGDHLILDKPRHGVYGVGRTHSVIALETPKNGIVKVVSYPNSKIPPRIEYYDLYGKGRTGKNGKPIRIQRAEGEGLSSIPRPTNKNNISNKKEDNLSNYERQEILNKAPEYVKNLVRKYFPAEEFENALLTCYKESSFNKNAVNTNRDKYSSTDRGLFQINDHWHYDKYKGENIFDPEVNVRVAAKIFKQAGNSWKPWHGATKIGLI